VRYVEVAPGRVEVREGPAPRPQGGQALVRVTACGLCGSDLRMTRGMVLPRGVDYPVRPGHEVAGVVEELGPEAVGVGAGDAVVLHPLDPCGGCPACLAGREERCPSARVLGIHDPGGAAELVVWPARRMVAVTGLEPAQAALLPDALATAHHAVRMAGLSARDRLCVIGAGGVGTHVLELARALHRHLRIAAVVRSQASVERLRAAGFYAIAGLEGAAGRLREAFGRFDAVIDFSGSAAAPAEGVRLLDVGGRLVLGSVADEPIELGTTVTGITTRELAIMGCYVSGLDDLAAVARLALERRLPLEASVTHRVELARAPEAFELLGRRPPGLVRLVLLP
jgi:2-desacetyl-2-hydroxyethyl bacteriochlorophyllide A dehydrogenase